MFSPSAPAYPRKPGHRLRHIKRISATCGRFPISQLLPGGFLILGVQPCPLKPFGKEVQFRLCLVPVHRQFSGQFRGRSSFQLRACGGLRGVRSSAFQPWPLPAPRVSRAVPLLFRLFRVQLFHYGVAYFLLELAGFHPGSRGRLR